MDASGTFEHPCRNDATRLALLTVTTRDGSSAQVIAPLAFCEDHRDADLDSILDLELADGATFWERTCSMFAQANANAPERDRTRLEMIGFDHQLARQMFGMQAS